MHCVIIPLQLANFVYICRLNATYTGKRRYPPYFGAKYIEN